MGLARPLGFAGLPWDLDTIGAAATALGAAGVALARALSRRRVLDYRAASLVVGEIRAAARSSRTMLIAYERDRHRGWLATIEVEARDSEAASIAKAWTRRPTGKAYEREVIEPLLRDDEGWLVTSKMEGGSVLRDSYERDGTAASWLLVVGREDERHLRIVSINRRTEDPVSAPERATVRDLLAGLRESLAI